MNLQVCKICKSESAVVYLDIFGEINSSKNISSIISKHLWFEFKPSHEQQVICNECWNSLYDFNNFYETVEKIHHNDSEDFLAKQDPAGDPFGDDHFADNGDGLEQADQSEFPVEVKEEPLDDVHVDALEVFGASEPGEDVAPSEQRDLSETVTTRKSPRIQCKSVSKTIDTKEDTDLAYGRPRRRNTTRAVYKDDQSSSEDNKEGFTQSQSEESDVDDDDDSDEEIKFPSRSRERKRRKSSDTEDDNLDIKPEDLEEEDQETDAPTKASRAKRKKDTKLFEHIDEFICYICPERVEFERFYHATVHYKKHHKEPAYIKCKICDKRCYTPGNFISHVAVHTDPDKYRCQICGKQNDQKVALAKHMRIHRPEMDEKLPIKCRLCPRRFATEKKRDRHEKHHNRKPMEKPPRIVGRDEAILEFYKRIICEICDQQRMADVNVPDIKYDNMQDLKKHMREAHNDKGYLKCHMCDKKCNIRSMLLIHKDFHLNPDKYRSGLGKMLSRMDYIGKDCVI